MENPEPKIKIQKRTPTERQLEALEKARLQKQKKKIISEHVKADTNSFLIPPSYVTGLILLGFAGLGAYSYLREQKSSLTMESVSELLKPKSEPVVHFDLPEEITVEKTLSNIDQKTRDFFRGSTTV